ncbi:CbtA family protein [Aromatoleum diolicum]|uniref:Cobalt transporter subunit CbtA n=1 Tax=Aromatoleum diolicum TaxID=75796 RepID=A0ABX1Q9Z3_9RHOO|nr:CbtA family protein [Aromatoleum diolicum]NMG74322.1 hypothetical protein [Aromatoleum diolicum]
MLFRRIVLCALLVGALAGLLVSAVQHWQVIPIIAAAEVLESAAVPHSTEHEEHLLATAHEEQHEHDEGAWAPEDGAERHLWTAIANVTTAIGFGLILVAAITTWEHLRGRPLASARTGLLWGAAGFACVFVAPALGLPPEIPGAAAAPLDARQSWWLLAAGSTAAGLALLVFVPQRTRWLGLAVLALPFVVGAPHLDVGAYSGYSADAEHTMEALAGQFAIATAISSATEWLALGSLAGWAVARWVRPALATLGAPAQA